MKDVYCSVCVEIERKKGAIKELEILQKELNKILCNSKLTQKEVPEYITEYEVVERIFNRNEKRIKGLKK